MGSPPRGRGKVQSSFLLPDIYGITPAWAGKREPGVLMVWQFQDHPRVGGEKILEPSMGVGNFGSPPRGRGKAVKFRCTCGLQRITPAQAGKRTCTNTRFRFQEDHPRVGGEKSWWGDEVTPKQGSPPRGRGKVHRQGREGRSRRITPAWAGKSDSRQFSNAPRRDHPRMGGEKCISA